MLYELKNGSNATVRTKNIIEMYGESASSIAQYQRLFQKFWNSDYNLEDYLCAEIHREFDDNVMCSTVELNHEITIEELTNVWNANHVIIQHHF